MRFPGRSGLLRNVATSIAFLLLSCSFLLTAVAQDSPKPPAPSAQSASNAPPSVNQDRVPYRAGRRRGNRQERQLPPQSYAAGFPGLQIYKDNKEQKIVSLSFGSEALAEAYVPKDISARQI
jgi:hypothetical protein